MKININHDVVEDFSREWGLYTHTNIDEDEFKKIFDTYFAIFPFDKINENSIGFDMGCGSGRWAKIMAKKVGLLNCIDPGKQTISIARENLKDLTNCVLHHGSVAENNIPPNSQDFGYSLGVLHHVPDTLAALKSVAQILKKDGIFLLYLYYNLEGKPLHFKLLWRISDLFRIIISRFPFKLKIFTTNLIAYAVYLPLATLAKWAEAININVSNFPLEQYRGKNMYVLKTDSLDRFGTKLEQRFSKKEISEMLITAGFRDIKFAEGAPYYVCVAVKG